jgi:hypothetical protein
MGGIVQSIIRIVLLPDPCGKKALAHISKDAQAQWSLSHPT